MREAWIWSQSKRWATVRSHHSTRRAVCCLAAHICCVALRSASSGTKV